MGCRCQLLGALGYSIGTPVLTSCLKINDSGNVSADYNLKAPVIQTDIIRATVADHTTVDDNVILTGNLVLNGRFNYNPSWVAGKLTEVLYIFLVQHVGIHLQSLDLLDIV